MKISGIHSMAYGSYENPHIIYISSGFAILISDVYQ